MTGTTEGRLVGLDVARCLALLGMVATHVLDARTPAGDLTTAQWLAGGRASALFAVLAGVSLALMTSAPLRGRALARRSAGSSAGRCSSPCWACCSAASTRASRSSSPTTACSSSWACRSRCSASRTLLPLTVVWIALAPVVSHLVRPHLPERGFESPTFDQLADPAQLAGELLLTGYYPVVPWLAYLLAGLVLARIDLRSPRLLGALALGGLGTAVLATRISGTLVDPALGLGERHRHVRDHPGRRRLELVALVAPHSATPFDLAQTIGSALLVIACCLLLERLLPRAATCVLAVVFGAGTMTLSLYSLHVVMRTDDVWPPEDPRPTSPRRRPARHRCRPPAARSPRAARGGGGAAGPAARRAALAQRSGTNR